MAKTKNNRKKVVVVMPAYNAAKTVEKTFKDLPKNMVDEVILVDDCSRDNTVEVARKLNIKVFEHKKNMGYGGNQKTCYKHALASRADIVVMLHPDYQYDAALIGEMIKPIIKGRFDVMLGSRIRTRKEALSGGMPPIKYLLNRMTCVVENMVLGVNLTDHFSGFRAYSKKVLNTLPYENFSDDFVFDQELEVSAIEAGFEIGETPVPVRYFNEASSIGFVKGAKFMLETYKQLILYVLAKSGVYRTRIFLIL